MASCLSCSEISGTELCASVTPKGFGWTDGNRLVGPSSSQRKHLSPQLTRQVRSPKDLQGIGCRECRKEKKLKRSLDEVGNKYAWDKCKSTKRNTRELHLELVGDKVTYVRVYWLRSQVRSLDHRSYSCLISKWGYHFLFKLFDVFTSCRVALTHDLE